MSFIQMRTVPGLFIGRRTVLAAAAAPDAREGGYRCGACEQLIHAPAHPDELRDVVVRCGCGEINQL
jgi:hypothetical protein